MHIEVSTLSIYIYPILRAGAPSREFLPVADKQRVGILVGSGALYGHIRKDSHMDYFLEMRAPSMRECIQVAAQADQHCVPHDYVRNINLRKR